MYGSNWPVCLLASDYRRIKSALEQCIASLSAEERAEVMGGSALAAYGLQLSARAEQIGARRHG
jgi:L-fuconolactonase